MAVLTTQQVLQTGTTPATTAAAGGGDKVVPGDTTWIEVTNGGGSSITVTIEGVTPSNYGDSGDKAVAVAAGATKRIGPITPTRFMDSDGYANITYSSVTTVTVAAWKI